MDEPFEASSNFLSTSTISLSLWRDKRLVHLTMIVKQPSIAITRSQIIWRPSPSLRSSSNTSHQNARCCFPHTMHCPRRACNKTKASCISMVISLMLCEAEMSLQVIMLLCPCCFEMEKGPKCPTLTAWTFLPKRTTT